MEPRIVATLNAQNRLEAKMALDLLKDKIQAYGPDEPISEHVEVTNEGTM